MSEKVVDSHVFFHLYREEIIEKIPSPSRFFILFFLFFRWWLCRETVTIFMPLTPLKNSFNGISLLSANKLKTKLLLGIGETYFVKLNTRIINHFSPPSPSQILFIQLRLKPNAILIKFPTLNLSLQNPIHFTTYSDVDLRNAGLTRTGLAKQV